MSAWVSVDDRLPPMFQDVLVYGVQERANVLAQVWQARRWTGSNQSSAAWDWLTPTDHPVVDVRFWMHVPDFPQAMVSIPSATLHNALNELSDIISSWNAGQGLEPHLEAALEKVDAMLRPYYEISM
jgi:hypothetical protein